LTDAEKVTEIKPDWAKGWGRKGAALHGKGDLIGALDAYEEGLKHDPNNAQNQAGLASVKRAIDAEAKEGKDRELPIDFWFMLTYEHRWRSRRPFCRPRRHV
jgi:stress-induced-phosphoprotein 1